jgi:hypothetical protein
MDVFYTQFAGINEYLVVFGGLLVILCIFLRKPSKETLYKITEAGRVFYNSEYCPHDFHQILINIDKSNGISLDDLKKCFDPDFCIGKPDSERVKETRRLFGWIWSDLPRLLRELEERGLVSKSKVEG